ncbi:MAG: phospholipid carrier-dependent glycosyltransferase [bacterium]
MRSEPRTSRALIALALFVGCATLYAVALEGELGNADEGAWIPQAARSWWLVSHGRFHDPFWSENDMLWGFASPPISKCVMGLGMASAGWGPESVRPNATFAGQPGYVPTPGALRAGRLSSVVLGAAAVAVLFLFLARDQPLGTAAWAAVLLASSPLWFRASRRAMTDMHGLAASMLALAAFAAARARTRAGTSPAVRAAWWVLLGALLGTAVGCKFSAAGGAAGLVAWLLVAELGDADPARTRLARLARALVAPAVCIAAALGVFVATYPYLWPNPVGRFRWILSLWRSVLEGRADFRPVGFENAFRPGLASVPAAADVLVLPGGVLSWGLPLALVAGWWLRRRRSSVDVARVGAWAFAAPVLVGGAILATAATNMSQSWIVWAGLLGATASTVAVPGALERLRASEPLVVFTAWSSGGALFALASTYYPWPRYYLPIVPACAVAAALGLGDLRRSIEALAGRWAARLVDVAAAAGVASVLVAFPRTGAASLRKVAAGDLGPLPEWLQRVAAACLVAALAVALAKAASRRSGEVAAGTGSPSAR